MYTVKYSPKALEDLDKVWEGVFEASKSYDVTKKYLNDILDMVEAKADFPFSGSPLIFNDMFTGYYFLVFKKYMVFYRIEGASLYVDRVLLGKSDYVKKLGLTAPVGHHCDEVHD